MEYLSLRYDISELVKAKEKAQFAWTSKINIFSKYES